MRRSGFATRAAARKALGDVLDRLGDGVQVDDEQTVGAYLTAWLAGKRRTLKPKTLHGYSEYVTKDLVPGLGHVPLERLRHEHIGRLVDDLERAGRGPTTITRIHAVLSSALSDAVERRRLTHNPAAHVDLPKVPRTEQAPWSATEAIRFLAHAAESGERLADIFEVMAGTGLRRGECLALRWPDIDLDARVLHVDPERGHLSDVAGRLVFTAPKTDASAAGVGLSSRVVAALRRQRERQDGERAEWGGAYEDDGLVFARENGAPLRPEHVLKRFHALSDAAGVRRTRLHDLRHLAATLLIASGVALPLVSKVLRHSSTAVTDSVYSHLTRETSVAAADQLGAALDAAAAEWAAEKTARAGDHPATAPAACDHDATT
jgi:integrase